MKNPIKNLLLKLKTGNANQQAKIEQFKNAALFCLVAGASYGFYWYSSQEVKPVKHEEKPAFDGAFDSAFSKVSDEALIEQQQRQIDELKTMFKKNEETLAKTPAIPPDNDTKILVKALEEKLGVLEAENKKTREALQVALINSQKSRNDATQAPIDSKTILAQRVQTQKAQYASAGFETVHFNHRSPSSRHERTPDNYVWAGTFAEGILISGAKGDAGINGSKNMGTALIRLDSDGIMPNNKHSHLKGCFALVSTYGDLSEDAVVMQLETLSCVGRLNFERKVYGSVFDLDAMQDIRGTSILKTKPLLSYTAAAGFLAGIGDGLKNYGTAQSINPQTGAITMYSTAANLAQSAGGGALTNPANRISDYIMKVADIYHPVVVARAGRRVSVMFSKGFWIDRKHQVYESGKALDRRNTASQNAVTTTVTSNSGFEANSADIASNQTPVQDKREVAQQFLQQNGVNTAPLFSTVPQGVSNHG